MKVVAKIHNIVRFLLIRVRSFFYTMLIRLGGGECGRGLKIHGPIYILGNLSNLKIGENVSINHFVLLNCRDLIEIGEGTTISAGCQLQTPYLIADQLEVHASRPIIVKRGCWLAVNVIVTAGSLIEENVIVGALSLVRGRLEKNGMYAGSPAVQKRILRR